MSYYDREVSRMATIGWTAAGALLALAAVYGVLAWGQAEAERHLAVEEL